MLGHRQSSLSFASVNLSKVAISKAGVAEPRPEARPCFKERAEKSHLRHARRPGVAERLRVRRTQGDYHGRGYGGSIGLRPGGDGPVVVQHDEGSHQSPELFGDGDT